MKCEVELSIDNFTASHVLCELVEFQGEQVVRVEKHEKLEMFDEDTFVLINNVKIQNGAIQATVRSRLLPNAPDFARGFIGLVFRVNDNNSEFESYYVRPTNGRHPDPVRRAHGSQYFAYPGYTFSYFREHKLDGFEAPVDIDIDEWITIRIEFLGEKAKFFVNDLVEPVLIIDSLKHGNRIAKGIGLYVDTGTEGFFKDLIIEDYDN